MSEEIDVEVLRKRAEKFNEEIEVYLKRYSPEDYAIPVSILLDEVLEDFDKARSWPPHFLLHSIEANCVFHRKHRYNKLTVNELTKVIRTYINYYDPVAEFYLTIENKLEPFLISMARQQFTVQNEVNINDLGRSIVLFTESTYKVEKKFIQKFNLSFKEWIISAFSVYAGVQQKRPALITPGYLINSEIQFIRKEAVNSFFSLMSFNPDEVREYNNSVRNRVGNSNASQFETYLEGVFSYRPLLKLKDDNYLVVHKHYVLKQVYEGIYNICKTNWQGEFGDEFGKKFERYVGRVLSEFIDSSRIYKECDLQRFTEKKVCDYVINFDDYLLLIECKGTGYSSIVTTETSLIKDNSTKKISNGIEQLASTAKQIKDKVFEKLLGDTKSKKVISIIVTFKHVYFTNTQWYWDNIIKPSLESDICLTIINYISFRPQTFSIDELEMLLLYSSQYNKSSYEIFSEKLSQPEHLTGEWLTYLKINNDRGMSFLKETFNKFIDDNIRILGESIG